MRIHFRQIITLFILTVFIYLPLFVTPEIFLDRGNDLTEFFWPIILFIKKEIVSGRGLPFWFPHIFSGTPLLPDPQSQLFYLPNIIFLSLPIGTGFIVGTFLHTFWGGLGAYLAAKQGFGLDKKASLLAGLLYLISPRAAGFMEAGHWGLILATAWLPWVVLAILREKPVLLAISLAALFYTHTITFVTAAVASGVLLIASGRKIKPYLLGAILTFSLTAVALLPQLAWASQTARVVIKDNQVYPVWTSKFEVLVAMFTPNNALDAEKWLAIGIIPTLLALWGFVKLKSRKTKVILTAVALGVILIALNNASPLHSFLINQKWYVFGRVSTRIWFVITLMVTFLAAYGYQKLGSKKIVLFLAVGELVFIFWMRLAKPIIKEKVYLPQEAYEFLCQDKDRFRVFCINRCIPQKEAVARGLELVEGYGTLVQTNYYQHAWGLTGGYWNYYTLSIPPIGLYQTEKLQPNAQSLGEYNTKYIISPHELADENFILKKKFGDYLVYSNKLFQPRANAPITFYSPNKITVDTTSLAGQSLILADVYSPGWKAYLYPAGVNGREETIVQETPNRLRAIDIKPNTKLVELKYPLWPF